MSTFVAVGNAHQPFVRLLRSLASNIELLPRPVLVQHGHTPFSHPDCDAVRFISRQEFDEAIRSDIVILHAGAGSILQCLWAGKVPIVMPRLRRFGEHVDDHQVDLAHALDRMGRVKRIDDSDELRRAVLWARSSPDAVTAPSVEPNAVRAIRDAIRDTLSATPFP